MMKFPWAAFFVMLAGSFVMSQSKNEVFSAEPQHGLLEDPVAPGIPLDVDDQCFTDGDDASFVQLLGQRAFAHAANHVSVGDNSTASLVAHADGKQPAGGIIFSDVNGQRFCFKVGEYHTFADTGCTDYFAWLVSSCSQQAARLMHEGNCLNVKNESPSRSDYESPAPGLSENVVLGPCYSSSRELSFEIPNSGVSKLRWTTFPKTFLAWYDASSVIPGQNTAVSVVPVDSNYWKKGPLIDTSFLPKFAYTGKGNALKRCD